MTGTTKRDKALADLAKRLEISASFYRNGLIHVKKFLADLDDMHTESLAIRDTGRHVETPDQVDSRGKALLSWARDIKLQEFVQSKHINLDRKSHWYWVVEDKQHIGAVAGLPSRFGIPRITNGIFVYLEREDGSFTKAHWDWFEAWDKSAERSVSTRKNSKAVEKTMQSLAEYLDGVTI